MPVHVGASIYRYLLMAKRACTSCLVEKSPACFHSNTDPICKICKRGNHNAVNNRRRREKMEKTLQANAKRAEHFLRKKNALTLPAEPLAVTPEAKEAASRIISRRRLLPFVLRFQSNYLPGWVHEDICRRLERFVRDVELGKSPRLLICMPPRAGKSTLTSRFFPAWLLGQHPEWEVIAASHTQSLALKFSGFIRDLLRDPSYQAVFPECKLDPESQSKEAWDTTSGGGYLAAGIGTGITGRGAHVLIIDDPVKDMEAADSVTIRDNTWEWYGSTAYTRLAPGGGVLGILTLWNEDDWGGRIIEVSESGEGDKFEIVRYPAINEGYDEYLAEDDTIEKVFPGQEPSTGSVLVREMDSALHPERYSLEMLLKIRKNFYARGNQRTWSALYQQNPTVEDGNFFTKDMMRYYTHEPPRLGRFLAQAWDFAITTKQSNDFTACSTMLQDERDDVYELDLLHMKSDDSFIIVDAILDQYEKYAPNYPDVIGFEDGQIWKSIKALFEKRCHERHLYPSYEVLTPLSDKNVRAGPLRGRMQQKKVYFRAEAPYRRVADREMLSFSGGGKHDDIVDARAWCIRLMLGRAAPRLPAPKPLKGWRDRLREQMAGLGDDGSHMGA